MLGFSGVRACKYGVSIHVFGFSSGSGAPLIYGFAVERVYKQNSLA